MIHRLWRALYQHLPHPQRQQPDNGLKPPFRPALRNHRIDFCDNSGPRVSTNQSMRWHCHSRQRELKRPPPPSQPPPHRPPPRAPPPRPRPPRPRVAPHSPPPPPRHPPPPPTP